MHHKQFVFSITLIVISIVLFSNCKSRTNRYITPEFEYVVDLLFFTKDANSSENKYAINQEFIKYEKFVLKHKGNVFFEGNNALKDYYLYEGFKEQYFFITPMEKGNNLASPFHTKRDSVFLFDTKDGRLYSFNANEFLIVAGKYKPPTTSPETINQQKKNGFRLSAVYDSINTETKELFLLLDDLQTIEVLKLNLIQ